MLHTMKKPGNPGLVIFKAFKVTQSEEFLQVCLKPLFGPTLSTGLIAVTVVYRGLHLLEIETYGAVINQLFVMLRLIDERIFYSCGEIYPVQRVISGAKAETSGQPVIVVAGIQLGVLQRFV